MTPLWLTLALLTSSTEPAPPASAPAADCAATSFIDCLQLTLGLGVFGDAYAFSSVNAPDTGKGQRSLMGGLRFWIGTRWPGRVALRGVFDFGYVTVGPFPTRGTDGLKEAAGLEVSLDTFALVKPFVRFMYDVVIQRIGAVTRDPGNGELKSNAFLFHAGAFFRFVEVHLALGRDYAGGFSPGIGFSVAWID